jgi:hypothetical protein
MKDAEKNGVEKCFQTVRGKFRIRTFTPGDEISFLSLWKSAFKQEMSLPYFYWKYLENPFGCQIFLCEEESSGKIIAFFAGVPYKANYKGTIINITQLMDSMSHPLYRGTGLFVSTAQFFFEHYGQRREYNYYYGFPGIFHFKLGNKYLNYNRVSNPVFLSYRFTKDNVSGQLFQGRIDRVFEINTDFNDLFKTCLSDYPFSVIRNKDFLDWRFINHPEKKYEIWGYYSKVSDKLKGYIVFSRENKVAQIVDIFVVHSKEIIKDFILQLRQMLHKGRIRKIQVLLPDNHFITHTLFSLGFTPIRQPAYIVRKILYIIGRLFAFTGYKAVTLPLEIIPTFRSLYDTKPSLEWVSDNIFYTMADGDF